MTEEQVTRLETEIAIVNKLAEAWNMFKALPVEHNDDLAEFRAGIHRLQEKVLAREARRLINKREPEIKGVEYREFTPVDYSPKVKICQLDAGEIAKVPGPYENCFIYPVETPITAKSEEQLEAKIEALSSTWLPNYGDVYLTRRKVIFSGYHYQDMISLTGFFYDAAKKEYYARMFSSSREGYIDQLVKKPKE